MPGSIRLGRIGDTYIDVHITFIPVLIWAAALGFIQYGSTDGALFHTLAVMLLFGCVLLHEIAHTLLAVSSGIEVPYILLLPIGGMVSIESGRLRPKDEVKISLAGPLANFLIGLFFSLLILLSAINQGIDPITLSVRGFERPSLTGLVVYIAAANLLLTLFNLIPAFPLDGGRALRAMLSQRMSYEEATHRSAIAGRAFGAGLMAIGATMTFMGMVAYGLVLILVAWVIYMGATEEDRNVQENARLHRWRVGQLIRGADQVIGPQESLVSALASVARGIVVPVVVGEGARVVGLLTPRELRAMHSRQLSVAHVMRTRFPTVQSGDPLWLAYEKLRRSELLAIPVVNRGDNLCGLVTLADIRRAMRDGELPPTPSQFQQEC